MNTEHQTSNVEHSTTNKPQFEAIGNQLLVRAPAKINLSLLVAGKREDGYHDIESIMAKIDWFDEILIEKQVASNGCGSSFAGATEDRCDARFVKRPTLNATDTSCVTAGRNMQPLAQHDNSEPVIELICKGQYKVPEGEGNLVYKAAKLILEWHGHPGRVSTGWKPVPRVKITLTKNVPAGAGLGSGSSDAAATLMGINRFFKLGLSKRKLAGLAATLGSDVAFFLDGPLGLCTGRGEKVKKLARCEFRALLILPDISVSTAEVYANYRHDAASYHRLHKQISEYIDKKRIDLVCQMCANMLQESCFELHTELATLKKKVESRWLRPVCLSGSGSTMFRIIDRNNEEKVNACRDTLEQDYGCRGIIVDNNSW
jgi:4-diphosphocytidyl-2-C-methyl-D-erythritol kinase